MVLELDKLVDAETKKYELFLVEGTEPEQITHANETDKYILNIYEKEKDSPQPKVYFNVILPLELKSRKFMIGYEKVESSGGGPYSITEFQSKIRFLEREIEKIEKLSKNKSQSFINVLLGDIKRTIRQILRKTKKLKIKDYLSVEFLKEIEASKDFLEYENNWDGEGSKDYKKETLDKLNQFLINLSKEFYTKNKKPLITPYINPGMDGAIDLHWKTDKFELFLSIPERDDEPITYYGDDYRDNIIKGTLNIDNFGVLLSWIKTFH